MCFIAFIWNRLCVYYLAYYHTYIACVMQVMCLVLHFIPWCTLYKWNCISKATKLGFFCIYGYNLLEIDFGLFFSAVFETKRATDSTIWKEEISGDYIWSQISQIEIKDDTSSFSQLSCWISYAHNNLIQKELNNIVLKIFYLLYQLYFHLQ